MYKFCRTITGLSVLFLLFCTCDLPVNAQTTAAKEQFAFNTNSEETEKKSESKTNIFSASKPTRSNIFNTGNYPAQTQTLTLNEAIRRALENNNDIEVSRTDVRIQEQQLRALQGFYDPVISVSPTFTRNSVTGSNATKDFRLNAGVDKNIERGGGTITTFFNNNRTENSFAQSQLSAGQTVTGASNRALFSSNLGIQYIQPLWRNFRIDNNRRQIKVQRKRLQQSDADFRQQTLNIISQVQRGYWDLVFALRDQQNRTANLNLARENLRQIEARIAAGNAAPLARAEVATELANRETEVLTAVQQVAIAENTLKQLILRDPNSPNWRESLVPTDQPAFSLDAVVLDDALKDAIDNRPELRRLRLQREINDIDISFFKNQTKPQIDLNSTFSLNGLSQSASQTSTGDTILPQFSGNDEILRQNLNILLTNSNLPQIQNPNFVIPASNSPLFGGYGTALGNIFRSDAPNYSVGVTISLPLRNRTAEANLAGARIQQEQVAAQTRSQEQTIIAEVRNAVQAVTTARERVLTSRRARENAEIQLQGEQKLYESGRSTTFLLFQRENALAAARNSEIRAETDYNKALSDLQRATSTTFQVNNIEVQSPMNP